MDTIRQSVGKCYRKNKEGEEAGKKEIEEMVYYLKSCYNNLYQISSIYIPIEFLYHKELSV
jgi:hypothetical protein